MTLQIAVAEPRFWWRATAGDIERWIPEDPDVRDGRRRWADRDEQRWNLIAATVAQVGDSLAASAWSPGPDGDGVGFVDLDGYPGDLTATEQRIVSAWFRSSEAVRVDPWFEPLINGRHRLWSTMPHFGSSMIPIHGSALDYASSDNAEVLGTSWPDLFATNVEELHALEWFATEDPLNLSFRKSLITAASGSFPSPV